MTANSHQLSSLFDLVLTTSYIKCSKLSKDHGRETRNRGCLINLPPIKLEYARRGFYFMGAKLYNELPLNIRTAPNSEDFYKLLNLHFS